MAEVYRVFAALLILFFVGFFFSSLNLISSDKTPTRTPRTVDASPPAANLRKHEDYTKMLAVMNRLAADKNDKPAHSPTTKPAPTSSTSEGDPIVVFRCLSNGKFLEVNGNDGSDTVTRSRTDSSERVTASSVNTESTDAQFLLVKVSGTDFSLKSLGAGGKFLVMSSSSWTLDATAADNTDTAAHFRMDNQYLWSNGAGGYVTWTAPAVVRGLKSSGGAPGDCNARFLMKRLNSEQPASKFVQVEKGAEEEPLVLVTGANEGFWDRMVNYIGSVHKWAPDIQIVVVDLGLNEGQRAEAATWLNVSVEKFDFEKYPPHMRDLKKYAWKPLAMKLMLEKYPKIFYSDPSVEFRQPLTDLEDLINTQGYVYVHQEGLHTNLRCCGPVNELTHQGTFDALGFKREDYADKAMCAGGIQGYYKGSDAYNEVLVPTVECAMDVNCIAPPGSGIPNHRFDQSVFSLHINKGGVGKAPKFPCMCNSRYFAYNQTAQPTGSLDETNEVVIFMRRGSSRPYQQRILKK